MFPHLLLSANQVNKHILGAVGDIKIIFFEILLKSLNQIKKLNNFQNPQIWKLEMAKAVTG